MGVLYRSLERAFSGLGKIAKGAKRMGGKIVKGVKSSIGKEYKGTKRMGQATRTKLN